MDLNTLKIATKLNNEISQFEQALNCFEWSPEEGVGPFSTNPRVIIDFDGGDGREQIALPMNLSDAFINFMKSEIIKGRDESKAKFEAL